MVGESKSMFCQKLFVEFDRDAQLLAPHGVPGFTYSSWYCLNTVRDVEISILIAGLTFLARCRRYMMFLRF
jgi:hypothetical protein